MQAATESPRGKKPALGNREGAQEKARDGHYLALCFIGLLPYGQGKDTHAQEGAGTKRSAHQVLPDPPCRT